MSGQLESVHYYKIVKAFDINLKPYINMPMYDEHPDLGTFDSTVGCSNPKKGDYFIYGKEYRGLESDFNLEDVCFSEKVNIKELLEKKILCEASYEAYKADIKLSEDIRDVLIDIANTEMSIYSTKEEQQFKLKNLKNQLRTLILKRKKLEKVLNKNMS